MSGISKDQLLNKRLLHDRLGRTMIPSGSARWGELIEPAPNENWPGNRGGLRLVAITSFWIGFLVLETIKAYIRRYPGRIELVAVLTDDPINEDAKISIKKRIWHLIDADYYLDVEAATVESALNFGVPVYTGDVKNDWFRKRLSLWEPDAILCCGFGQLMDAPFLRAAPMGVINLHPSDLANSHGAGAAPHEDVRLRKDEYTCWTAHLMDEDIDHGPIIGSSPRIRVSDSAGSLDLPPISYYYKCMRDGLDYITVALLDALSEKQREADRSLLQAVDLEAAVPQAVRKRMLSPLEPETSNIGMPMPDPALFGE